MIDHGYDLVALQAHGHSIFSPSSSAMWLYCSGSLLPHIMAPDSAGEDAAEGTVGHTVGETWLNALKKNPFKAYRGMFTTDEWVDNLAPRDMIGEVVTIREFDITITEEMLAYVRKYVMWCVTLPGQHYIETRVDFSVLTPIPKQSGTADHAACQPGILTITDLKYGTGIRVFAKWNTQGLMYAVGFFLAHDHKYHFERIIIRIGQPRLDHWDEWEVSRAALLEFMEWVKVRAAAAWVPLSPRTPGAKQCQWCHVQGTCAANAAWLLDLTDGVFPVYDADGNITQNADGTIEGVSYTVTDMAVAAEVLVSNKTDLLPRDPGALDTEALELIVMHRKRIEKFFEQAQNELLSRANDGEALKHWKLVPGRQGNREFNLNEADAEEELSFIGLEADEIYTIKLASPSQLEEVLRKKYGLTKKAAAMLLTDLTTRQDGKPTLALLSDEREALPDLADDTFEPVDDL